MKNFQLVASRLYERNFSSSDKKGRKMKINSHDKGHCFIAGQDQKAPK